MSSTKHKAVIGIYIEGKDTVTEVSTDTCPRGYDNDCVYHGERCPFFRAVNTVDYQPYVDCAAPDLSDAKK